MHISMREDTEWYDVEILLNDSYPEMENIPLIWSFIRFLSRP